MSGRFFFQRLISSALISGSINLVANATPPSEPGKTEQHEIILTLLNAPATTVYSWSRDRCDQQDIPDAPPRVVRDMDNVLRMFASHDVTRVLGGDTFERLSHRCGIVFRGMQSAEPSDYNDRQWVTSLWTDDGRKIAALMHNEFYGHLRPWLCRSERYIACWENALTLAVSHDGGRSFTEKRAPDNVVASLDYRYVGDVGHPIGYFQPSNIVRADGMYYVMFHAEAYGKQAWGQCVAKSDNPFQPASWRTWDGKTFSTLLASPYSRQAEYSARTCRPVGFGALFDFGSLTRDEVTNTFVAVTSIQGEAGNALTPPGVYVTMSKDLINWDKPHLLKSYYMLRQFDKFKNNRYSFFSLIDEKSRSRNFDTISASPRLFLYFDKLYQQQAPLSRDLVKLPVDIARGIEAP